MNLYLGVDGSQLGTKVFRNLVRSEIDRAHRLSRLKQTAGQVGAAETSGAQSEDLHALD